MTSIKFTPAQNQWLEVTWTDDGQEVKHTSYHPTQLDMLKADIASFGMDLAPQHEAMLNEWAASYVAPPPPPPVVPQVLTMRQAKLVLLRHGMLDEVNNAVSRADEETRIEWEYATEVRRDWPTLAVMAAALNLDDKLLDALFIQGATL
jgi:hypothetical protein